MSSNQIDVHQLRSMFLAGAQNLEANKEWINELNVFPVPDGDTGTNMTLTILSAVKEVSSITEANLSMKTLSKAISSGSLRGARGNSGVILSQLLRGFTKEIRDLDVIDITTVASAFQRATDTAYKAVMKPKEGTILTVARGMAEKAAELADEEEDLQSFFEKLIQHGDFVLNQTPEMLPVLKQAGVVDSGGQGLMQVLKGAYDGYMGKHVETPVSVQPAAPEKTSGPAAADREHIDTAEIKFGYCTEFIILLEKEFTAEDEKELKAFLESIGDSIVCVADDEVVKIHVHTNHPGQAFEKGLTYGSLTRMKIDNMREEHKETLFQDAEKREAAKSAASAKEAVPAEPETPAEPAGPASRYGFIAVSVGAGLSEVFHSLGVEHLIEGGQTMNPSTEDVLNAVEKVNAENIFVLPNNKNIVLAANQAAALAEDKHIYVIPSKTIPQGIAAAISFNPDAEPEENMELMKEEMENVRSAEVTYAVRDSFIDGKEIHEGDYMGIGDHGIAAVGRDLVQTCVDTVKEMTDEDSELVTVYYGAEATEEAAGEIADKIREAVPSVEVEVLPGGQPVYYYLFSAE